MSGDVIARLNAALAGRYTIERELGAGGMATVYLCEDIKHKRKVALKLLKPELAAVLGAERFVQEITTTAALQHPHILPLFDSGTADGFLFYVMPFIQGETLRSKLDRETQLGVDEAVRIAREVADALDYAHRHGVVHRDVKPENILLHDGRPMVADFGIALAVSAAAGGRMTETGLSLGTPHYMSPEQATAEKEITGRSDVYSIGSVLYEMLTGNPPHTGASAQQIIMKIITEPAESVTKYRKSVPSNVAAAVAKSLEKLPADRFESAKAFADALGNAAFTTAGTAHRNDARAGVSSRAARSALIGGVVLSLVGTALAVWSLRPRTTASDEVLTMAFSTVSGQPIGTTLGRTAVFSPDGRTVVYSSTDSLGRGYLFARRLDDLQHHPISGTDRATDPVFSPDGATIAFLDGRTLRKIPAGGGTATPIVEVPGTFFGAVWTPEGIVYSSGGTLFIVPASGGTPARLLASDSTHAYLPFRLSDRLAGVTSLSSALGRAGILDLGTRKITDLGFPGSPVGIVDDQLIFLRGSDAALMAVPFDERKLVVRGSPRVLVNEVSRSASNMAKASVSASGSLVYVAGAGSQQPGLVDTHGVFRPLPIPAARFVEPRVAPDGKRLLMTLSSAGGSDVMMFDLASGAAKRVTTEGANNTRAEWFADGKRILYRTDRAGGVEAYTIWEKALDGSGADRELVRMKGKGIWQAIPSPDGQSVVFRTGSIGEADIWWRRLSGDTGTKDVSATKFTELAPRFSPDGRWLVYQTDESGTFEVVVRPFPGPGVTTPVSVGGGVSPMWSRDGRKIYYWTAGQLREATVSTSPTFSVTSRQTLFTASFSPGSGHAAYDPMPDGASFLMLQSVENRRDEIVVVHNLRALLRSRAQDAKGQ